MSRNSLSVLGQRRARTQVHLKDEQEKKQKLRTGRSSQRLTLIQDQEWIRTIRSDDAHSHLQVAALPQRVKMFLIVLSNSYGIFICGFFGRI